MRLRVMMWAALGFMAAALPGGGVVQAAPPPRPVAIFGSGAGETDVKLITYTCLLPSDARYDIAYQDAGAWLEPERFADFSAVVICHLGAKPPVWTNAQIETAVQYVRDGGHLVLLSNAPAALAGEGRDLKRIESLLGAGYWGSADSEGRVLQAGHPLTEHLEQDTYTWTQAGPALAKLSTAQPLAGTAKAAVVAVNTLGQGRVTFLGGELFRVARDSEADGEAYRRVIEAAILSANPERSPSTRERWDPTPLGPKVEPPPFAPAPVRQTLQPTLQTRPAQGQPVVLVNQGQPNAVIVLADRPTPAAREAARALQDGLRKMTGIELPIVAEGKLAARREDDRLVAQWQGLSVPAFVLVGASQLAQGYGFDPAQLPEEGYQLKTFGNAMLVAGRDSRNAGQPLMGTRHAAMALLERHLGFRWLWPGELGEVVPHRTTVVLGPMDEQDAPALRQRRLRDSGASGLAAHDPSTAMAEEASAPVEKLDSPRLQQGLDRLGMSAADFVRWHRDSAPWFQRQRLGGSLSLHYTHAYGEMWERFGETNPEWFALQATGTRTQHPERERLCVSNTALIEQIARDKIAELSANPGLDAASVSPNDGGAINSFCMCEACRQLDPPTAPPVNIMYQVGGVRRYFEYPSLTDRTLSFYSRIAERVAREHPDRWLGAYAYSAYRTPPVYAKAHPNLLIGFVGLDYFNDARLETDRQSWERWAQVAHQFFLRPNLFHSGHAYPAVYVTKLDQDIKRCYQTGMVATDFDSVMHHWSTQGLNYYVLAKLLWDPSQDVEAIVQDYCQAGFGSAASQVRSYFRELEALVDQLAKEQAEADRDDLRAEERDWLPGHGGFEARYFTPETLARLSQMLDAARAAAGDDAVVLKRIDFLALGLRYADLQARLREAALHNDLERGQALLDDRHAFFRQVFQEQPYAVNVTYLLWREGPTFYRTFRWEPSR